MENFLEIAEGAPWYVYLIFFYVVYIGLVSLRPRTVKFWRILLFPAALTLWSLSIVYSHWDGSISAVLTWVGCMVLGIGFGWWILKFYKFRVDRSRGTITVPGNRWTLVLVLALFLARYYFGYLYATKPLIPTHLFVIDFAISGFLIGIFVGRAFHYCRVYLKL